MNKIMTIANLMTILCDCVDSGSLEMDSPVVLYTQGLDYFDNKITTMCPAEKHKIITYMGKKAIELTK